MGFAGSMHPYFKPNFENLQNLRNEMNEISSEKNENKDLYENIIDFEIGKEAEKDVVINSVKDDELKTVSDEENQVENDVEKEVEKEVEKGDWDCKGSKLDLDLGPSVILDSTQSSTMYHASDNVKMDNYDDKNKYIKTNMKGINSNNNDEDSNSTIYITNDHVHSKNGTYKDCEYLDTKHSISGLGATSYLKLKDSSSPFQSQSLSPSSSSLSSFTFHSSSSSSSSSPLSQSLSSSSFSSSTSSLQSQSLPSSSFLSPTAASSSAPLMSSDTPSVHVSHILAFLPTGWATSSSFNSRNSSMERDGLTVCAIPYR